MRGGGDEANGSIFYLIVKVATSRNPSPIEVAKQLSRAGFKLSRISLAVRLATSFTTAAGSGGFLFLALDQQWRIYSALGSQLHGGAGAKKKLHGAKLYCGRPRHRCV